MRKEEEQDARIGIYLRLRPTPRPSGRVQADSEAGWVEFHMPKDAMQGLINNSRESYRFPFDGVLPPEAQQGEVFDSVAAPVLRAALDGYSGTVFAYGQTGSGKTFTISGGTERYADRGLIPRALAALYGEIAARGRDCMYTVHLSYMEIYNEVGYDLLDPGREVRLLEDLPRVSVMEDEEGGMHVRNLSLHRTANEEEALNLLFLGDTNRTVAETPLNQASSRSHCMFSLHLEARRAGEEVVRRSRVNFVDLAGSERVGKTGLEGAAALREAKHINLSLHFLEQVIICLQEGKPHVPYRNSLLTQLLRDSLGGNCRTVMIATVCPESAHVEESISTCRFAQRVAQISNKVSRNEEVDLPAVIRRLKAENQLLKQELQLMRASGSAIAAGGGTHGGAAAAGAAEGEGAGTFEAGQLATAGPKAAAAAAADATELDLRRQLSEGERRRLQQQLRAYLEDPSPDAVLGLEASMLFISNAFAMMKAMLLRTNGKRGSQRRALLALCLPDGRSDGAGEAGPGSEEAGFAEGEEVEEEEMEQEVRALRLSLQQKQQELDVLVGVLHKQGMLPASDAGSKEGMLNNFQQQKDQPLTSRHSSVALPSSPAAATGAAAQERDQPAMPITAEMLQDQNKAFEYFCASSPAHDIVQEHKALLRAKYDGAKALGAKVTASKQRIAQLKSRLEQRRLQRSMDALLHGQGAVQQAAPAAAEAAGQEDVEEQEVQQQIEQERAAYKQALGQLKGVKLEVEQLQSVLEHSRVRLQRDFQAWWGVISAAAAGSTAAESVQQHAPVAGQSQDWSIPAVLSPGSGTARSSIAAGARPATAQSLHTHSPTARKHWQPQQQQQAQQQQQQVIVEQPTSATQAVDGQQPSFAGWAGSAAEVSFRVSPLAAVAGTAATRASSSSSSSSRKSSEGRQAVSARGTAPAPSRIPAAVQPATAPDTQANSAAGPASMQPQQPAAAAAAAAAKPPDPLAGVDPEVLAAARPLLTGNPTADADIIKFYQARAALLKSQVFR